MESRGFVYEKMPLLFFTFYLFWTTEKKKPLKPLIKEAFIYTKKQINELKNILNWIIALF